MRSKCSGFALVDVLMAITLSAGLVILLMGFIRDMFQFTSYLERHRQLRAEMFSIMNFSVPLVIREAFAIDYVNSSVEKISVFMDPFEKKNLVFRLEPTVLKKEDDIAQIVLEKGSKQWLLNSQETVIERLQFFLSPQPRDAFLQDDRSYQPMIRVRITARSRRQEGARLRTAFSFFEEPRVTFETTVSLRNFSFPQLRS